jgi:Ca2+-binding EF-hand superfamily protein
VTVSKDTPNGVMKLVETIFEEYDSDHNGYICRKEYQDVATNFPFIGGFEQVWVNVSH